MRDVGAISVKGGSVYGTRAAVDAGNRFAVRLYEGVKRPGKNVAVGPLSVSNAMTLTASGARGKTREEMVRALGWEGMGDVEGEWGRLVGALREPMEEVDLRLGTGVWVREGIELRPEFGEVAARRFGADVETADLGRPAEAAGRINGWVERKTAGKITQLVGPGDVAGNDVIIGSTTYFKGAWTHPFWERSTTDEDFHVAAGRVVRVKMMRLVPPRPVYAETEACQSVWLPYAKGGVQMVVSLPKRPDGLEALERDVAAGGLGALGTPTVGGVEVRIRLPRFSIRGRHELVDPLRSMGMARAFNAGADFSAMMRLGGPFAATRVVHDVVVDVDEAGTEAAAATMVALMGGMPRSMPPRVEFRADHPFLFAIVHQRTGAILFMGRVVDPTVSG